MIASVDVIGSSGADKAQSPLWSWWSQAKRSMRPVAVVMVDVDAEHVLELSPADDQHPVEALAPDGADPALGERVRLRRPERCPDDLDAFASEDLVENVAELAVAIVDQVADRCYPFRERPAELACLLSRPDPAWVRGAAGQMHTPAAELDEEACARRN